MELAEIIDKQLERIFDLFKNEGEWTGTNYMTMVQPLHEALLELAKNDKTTDV